MHAAINCLMYLLARYHMLQAALVFVFQFSHLISSTSVVRFCEANLPSTILNLLKFEFQFKAKKKYMVGFWHIRAVRKIKYNITNKGDGNEGPLKNLISNWTLEYS